LRTTLVAYLIDKVIYLRLDARKLMFLIARTGHIPKDVIDARDRRYIVWILSGYYPISGLSSDRIIIRPTG